MELFLITTTVGCILIFMIMLFGLLGIITTIDGNYPCRTKTRTTIATLAFGPLFWLFLLFMLIVLPIERFYNWLIE